MANSLQEQLLKAGLVSAHSLRQTKTKQRRQQRQGEDAEAAARQRERQATEAAKRAQDRERNRQRDEEARRKAEVAALRELIHSHRLTREAGDQAYHFADGPALKRLYISDAQRQGLIAGTLVIVRQDTFYELIPAAIAARVAERDASLLLVWNRADQSPPDAEGGTQATAEDGYPPVPDDLMW